VAMDPTVCSQSHSTLSTTTIPNQMAASWMAVAMAATQ
jgi:hypothetical protein